jgi:hypothetical protein
LTGVIAIVLAKGLVGGVLVALFALAWGGKAAARTR